MSVGAARDGGTGPRPPNPFVLTPPAMPWRRRIVA